MTLCENKNSIFFSMVEGIFTKNFRPICGFLARLALYSSKKCFSAGYILLPHVNITFDRIRWFAQII